MYTLLNYKEFKKTKTNLLGEEVIAIINKISDSIGIQPKINKPEKIYTIPQQITILLNKLTEDNFKTIHDTIIELLQNNTFDFDEISVGIFNIIINNSFYVELYVKLYISLIKYWPIFKDLFYQRLNDHINNIKEIKYISSDNYDEFCKNNEMNERFRTFSQFIVYLTIYDITNIKKLNTLISDLITLLHNTNNTLLMDEVVEHLYLLISKSKPIHNNLDINRNSFMIKNVPNKILFRLMDILDII
jgi:hypothetical protein